MDDAILNIGLDLAMEWGEDWLQPIQKRLEKLRPELTNKQLDEYNTQCQAAMRFGHELVLDYLGSGFDTQGVYPEWERQMRAAYPWISAENLSRNFSQGCYYASK